MIRSSEDLQKQVPPPNRHERKEAKRFKSFTYEELIKRDTHSLPDSNVPGFPRHTQNLGASRRRAGLPASANLDILTPSFPTQSASRPSRLMLRSQQIQVWLKDAVTRVKERPGFPSLEDSVNLPDPNVIALQIVEDLEEALSQFTEVAVDLKR